MTAPRPPAAPAANAAKQAARALGATPRPNIDSADATGRVAARFGDLMTAVAPRKVAADAPAVPQAPLPADADTTTDGAPARHVLGLANELGVVRSSWNGSDPERGGPTPPASAVLGRTMATPVERSAPAAPAVKRGETVTPPMPRENPDPRSPDPQVVESLVEVEGGVPDLAPVREQAQAAAPAVVLTPVLVPPLPNGPSSKRQHLVAAERHLSHPLTSPRSAPDHKRTFVPEPQNFPPLDVRTSRLAATVSRLETHFAPVQPPIVASIESKTEAGRQESVGLFDQIRTVLDGGSERLVGDQRVASLPPQPAQSMQSAVRVLEITLHPAAFGSLTVTFRMTGVSTMKVTFAASERDTAAALGEDLEELASIVAAAGYAVDEIAVTHASTR